MKYMKHPAIHVGDRFGRLTVLAENGRRCRQRLWLCRCACGQERTVLAFSLKAGDTRSCGCLSADAVVARTTTHGLARHPLYNVWRMMLRRCYDPTSDNYARYGGRGIDVCERWHAIEHFVPDMGDRPRGAEIDRINNDGPYEPLNCRWATRTQQMANTSVSARYFTLDDEPVSVVSMAHHLAMPETTLRRYLSAVAGGVQ